MKKFRFLAMAAAVAMMLGSCSDDDLNGGGNNGSNNPEAEDGVYFSIRVDLPNAPGSRSETGEPGNNGSTSNTGVEIGKGYENNVDNALVVLAKASDNSFIAAAPVANGDLAVISTDNSAYRALSKFTKTQLSAYYRNGGETVESTANIFVFANPTDALNNAILGDGTSANPGAALGDTDWFNKAQESITNVSVISTRSKFLMSNALIATRQIPPTLDGWNYYTSKDKPFNLSGFNGDVNIENGGASRGNIKIQRVAARFDFRDGSIDGLDENKKKADPALNGIGNFTYEVVYDGTFGQENRTALVNITLQRMALVNVNKKTYFLSHVSPTGSTDGMEICKPEQPWIYNQNTGELLEAGNYVVDANYAWKSTVPPLFGGTNPPSSINYSDNFISPFFNDNGTIDNNNASNDRWSSSLCEEVISGEEDNNVSWNNSATYGDYRIWKYATENTIAGVENQINGITTGVVFKGKMVATQAALNSTDEKTKELAEIINNTKGSLSDSYKDPILYLFSGNLYMGWENIREAAVKAAVPGFIWNNETSAWEPQSLNRTNALYVAVFGKGGFGTIKFKYNVVNEAGEVLRQEEIEYTDPLAMDNQSANAAWNAWNAAQKPSSGTDKDLFKQRVTDADITIYQSSNDPKYGWGYYCYYYYWNRHNDNGNNGVMGEMEFAVVRNNVYKLAVTKLSRLGHPRISENDPDKPEGGTPDESEDLYIAVTSEVMPWVVRINNVEF